MQTQKQDFQKLQKLEEQRRKGRFGEQTREFQRELDMLYETKHSEDKLVR